MAVDKIRSTGLYKSTVNTKTDDVIKSSVSVAGIMLYKLWLETPKQSL